MTHPLPEYNHPLRDHSPNDLLDDLCAYLSWAMLHLDEYRDRHPYTPTHITMTEIHYHIRQAIHWLDTLPPRAQEDSHD
ncbi:MAG: hypothetical protein DDT29_02228 [Dehalococcoidia bacterium]|nr:hypothetical protein [Bacillota bacterium]